MQDLLRVTLPRVTKSSWALAVIAEALPAYRLHCEPEWRNLAVMAAPAGQRPERDLVSEGN